ncbi:MAG TPA: hypothetical protein VMW89_15820 [Desulfatiglandales bacterium]|nr:hypothetical protein [Desulfatiglandales bacterium]
MKGYIGITDNDWFAFLSQQPGIDEVNFLPKTTRQKTAGKLAKKTADKSARKMRVNLEQKWVQNHLQQAEDRLGTSWWE